MNVNRCPRRYCVLGLTVGFSLFFVGCATQPLAKAPRSYQLSDIEGTWSWTQDPWHGDFVLKKDGDSCSGTLNDVYEGTYGDKITDVTISDNHIRFTRNGTYGVQQWEGTLKKEKGVLKIMDGRWTKAGRSSGAFHAEKKE